MQALLWTKHAFWNNNKNLNHQYPESKQSNTQIISQNSMIFSMIFQFFSNSMIFPCMELFFVIFQVFQCSWEPCRRYAPDRKNLEMRPEVNVKVKVTQNGMHHSAIPRGINTPYLGFLHQIILEICTRLNAVSKKLGQRSSSKSQ